ncbi:MAG TPA: hypothetical protein VFJ71_05815 [Candidatus Limnocylindrales bacterium]|nr:hypothetical protein [Candidatus Limnocylindrales bacterium]
MPVRRRQPDADSAAVGPPALLPSMIYREILFDASEMTPVWARPRESATATAPAPGDPATDRSTTPAGPEETVEPKRQRRTRAKAPGAPASETAGRDKPKRTRRARPPGS